MNHGVRKFWILLVLNSEELFEVFGLSLALDIGHWKFSNFSNAVPDISPVPTIWIYFF